MVAASGAHHAAVLLQPGNFPREISLPFSSCKADPSGNPRLDFSSRHSNHLYLSRGC